MKVNPKLIFSFFMVLVVSSLAIYMITYRNITDIVTVHFCNNIETKGESAYSIIDLKYTGEWQVKDGILIKGDTIINSNFSIVDDIKETTGCIATIFLNDIRVSTTVITQDRKRAIGTKATDEVIETVLKKGQAFIGQTTVLGEDVTAYYKPLKDSEGKVIGMWFVGVEKTEINKDVKSIMSKIGITLFFMLICGVFVSFVFGRITIKTLAESEEKHRLLITQMQQGLSTYEVISDEAGKAVDFRFLDANESFEHLTGLKHENILGKTVLEVMPEMEDYWIEKFGYVAMTGEPIRYENYSGALSKYFEAVIYSPRPKHLAMIMSDITERKRMETALAQEKNLLETTLISVGDGVISTDSKGNIVFINRVSEVLTGWTHEDARGKSIEEVFNIINEFTREKCENIVKKVLESGKIHELANHTLLISKNGVERPIEDSAAPIMKGNGEIVGVVLVFRDFSEKKQRQEEILYLSYHDHLTGLYNRRFYKEELKRLDTKRNLPMSIVMGDVNGLKLINDSFGHVAGDELLKKVAEVLKKGCRADDIIARLGGDEFIIILLNFPTMKSGSEP